MLCRALAPGDCPTIIYDVTGGFLDHPAASVVGNLRAVEAHWRAGFQFIVYPRTDLDPAAFDDFCSLAFRLSVGGGPLCVLCDEVGRVTGSRASDALKRCLTLGRHAELSMILATQRPRGVPAEIFSEATDLYAFPTRYLPDAQYILSCFPEGAGVYGELGPYEWMHVDRRGAIERGKVAL